MKLQTLLSALRKCEREYVDYALSQHKPCPKFLARRERLADKLERRIVEMFDDAMVKVTHWMPLPPAPKEESYDGLVFINDTDKKK